MSAIRRGTPVIMSFWFGRANEQAANTRIALAVVL